MLKMWSLAFIFSYKTNQKTFDTPFKSANNVYKYIVENHKITRLFIATRLFEEHILL